MRALRVLVIDDTIVYRTLISELLEEIPGVEVVGKAANGKMGLVRIESLKPDLVTLDIEMPGMNGHEVLEAIREKGFPVGAIVLSAITQRGSEETLRSLELGAFDFITKPDGDDRYENRRKLKEKLQDKVASFIKYLSKKSGRTIGGAVSVRSTKIPPPPRKVHISLPVERPRLVVIGVSTGGPVALAQLLPEIPKNISVPILIVQHMPPIFTATLAKTLDKKSAIRVKEAEDGEIALPGTAYIAPGGKQMKITAVGAQKDQLIRITDDPPENNCRPSVDYLFRSAANNFPGMSVSVILTGMGSDGLLGTRLLKRRGAVAIAQDEESSVVYGMGKAVVDAGIVDMVLPLNEIADSIVKSIKG